MCNVHWNIPPLFTCKAATNSCYILNLSDNNAPVLSSVPTKCPNFGLYWPLVDYFVITISTITPPKYHSMKSSHVQWLTSQVATCDGKGVNCDTSSVTCVQLWHVSPNMWWFYTVIYWRGYFITDWWNGKTHDNTFPKIEPECWNQCVNNESYTDTVWCFMTGNDSQFLELLSILAPLETYWYKGTILVYTYLQN